MSQSPSPSPPDLDNDDDAQARLAQLEALLAHQLFAAPAPTPSATHSAEPVDRPTKKKKLTHDNEQGTETSEGDAGAGGISEEGAAEVTAFRLFSTQKAPQTVVLREAKSPEPFVLDRRIRAVEDEPEEVVEARRLAIEQLAVDGNALLAASRLPPSNPRSHSRLSSTRLSTTRLVPPSSSSSSRPPPTLAYLNALLPPSLRTLSPSVVPNPTSPPERPNEGLLARPPFKVYDVIEAARAKAVEPVQAQPESKNKRKRMARQQAEAEAAAAASAASADIDRWADEPLKKEREEKRRRTKDPRPKMPKRRLVEAFEQQHLVPQGRRRVLLKVVPILKPAKKEKENLMGSLSGLVLYEEKAKSGKTAKGGVRGSKRRRERVRRRMGLPTGGGGGAKAVVAAG